MPCQPVAANSRVNQPELYRLVVIGGGAVLVALGLVRVAAVVVDDCIFLIAACADDGRNGLP